MSDVTGERPDAGEEVEIFLEDGSLLFSEGDQGSTAFMVLEGEIEVFMNPPGDSEEIILTYLGPGEFVGHFAMLDDQPRSASARAKGDTRLRVIDRDYFMNQLAERPDLAMQIMHGLAGAVRGANTKIVSSTIDNTDGSKAARRNDTSEESLMEQLFPWGDRTNRVISSFQPDALEIEHRPFPAIARLGAYAIISFLVAIVSWASIAVIDTAVSTRGVTAPTGANILVQATEPGIIRKLHVSEGQQVVAGDPLVSFDDTEIQAQILAAVARRDNLAGRLGRLRLEFENRMQPVDELPVFSEDEIDNQRQRDLYASRLSEFSSQIGSYRRRLENLEIQANAIDGDITLAERQLALLKELETSRANLVEKEVMSRVQLMTTVFDRIGTERDINQLRNRVAQFRSDIEVTRSERDVYVSNWFSQLTEDLLATREDLIQVEEELVTLHQRERNLDIHATADAIVLETHGFADGSVIRAAETIIDMVPHNSEILVRVDIDAKDISNVTVGSRVSVKLDALPFQKHGDLIGRVDFISEDTFDETLLGQEVPVYRARIHVEANQLTDLPPDFRLIPGMNLTGDIRTGQRRVITYFIYPVLRWLKTSFRET